MYASAGDATVGKVTGPAPASQPLARALTCQAQPRAKVRACRQEPAERRVGVLGNQLRSASTSRVASPGFPSGIAERGPRALGGALAARPRRRPVARPLVRRRVRVGLGRRAPALLACAGVELQRRGGIDTVTEAPYLTAVFNLPEPGDVELIFTGCEALYDRINLESPAIASWLAVDGAQIMGSSAD